MKSLLATACTLSLLLAAADQVQAGPRDGFTGMTTATAKANQPLAIKRQQSYKPVPHCYYHRRPGTCITPTTQKLRATIRDATDGDFTLMAKRVLKMKPVKAKKREFIRTKNG